MKRIILFFLVIFFVFAWKLVPFRKDRPMEEMFKGKNNLYLHHPRKVQKEQKRNEENRKVFQEKIKKPKQGDLWYWQLDGKVPLDRKEKVYDIDLFENSKEFIQKLHKNGKYVICYINAGAYEAYRPDSSDFPEKIIGNKMEGWEDEKWIDIRTDEVRNIMEKRIILAKKKLCDAVEFDNVDSFENDTGFFIKEDDQLKYNMWLTERAHFYGLAAALKNDVEQIQYLEPYFDFAIGEECFEEGNCKKFFPFIKSGKAVFGVEYNLEPSDFCGWAIEHGFSWAKADHDLSGLFISCT